MKEDRESRKNWTPSTKESQIGYQPCKNIWVICNFWNEQDMNDKKEKNNTTHLHNLKSGIWKEGKCKWL